MKKLFTIVTLLSLITFLTDAQSRTTGEFFIQVTNNTGGVKIDLDVTLVSDLCWNASENDYDWHPLTNEFDYTHEISGDTTTANGKIGLDLCYVHHDAEPYLGLGRYLIRVRENSVVKDIMYMDYRTSDLPEGAIGGRCNF